MGSGKAARRGVAAILGLALLAPSIASAQFSESYQFLKAVKDRDGGKVNEMLGEPGTVIVNTQDRTTGESALHMVVKRRDMTWLGFLIGKGANVNARDNDGNTPLMAAAQIGFADGAQLLLDRKASVDLANGSGETPLIRAVQNRDAAMVRLLLGAGADPKKTDSVTGMSARDYAQRDGRSATILKMLDDAKPAAAKKVAGPSL